MIPDMSEEELRAATGNPVAKPISTDWVMAGGSRTVAGATQHRWLCMLCGDEQWTAWGGSKELPQHDCPELEFVESPHVP